MKRQGKQVSNKVQKKQDTKVQESDADRMDRTLGLDISLFPSDPLVYENEISTNLAVLENLKKGNSYTKDLQEALFSLIKIAPYPHQLAKPGKYIWDVISPESKSNIRDRLFALLKDEKNMIFIEPTPFNFYAVLNQIIGRITIYCNRIKNGEWSDILVKLFEEYPNFTDTQKICRLSYMTISSNILDAVPSMKDEIQNFETKFFTMIKSSFNDFLSEKPIFLMNPFLSLTDILSIFPIPFGNQSLSDEFDLLDVIEYLLGDKLTCKMVVDGIFRVLESSKAHIKTKSFFVNLIFDLIQVDDYKDLFFSRLLTVSFNWVTLYPADVNIEEWKNSDGKIFHLKETKIGVSTLSTLARMKPKGVLALVGQHIANASVSPDWKVRYIIHYALICIVDGCINSLNYATVEDVILKIEKESNLIVKFYLIRLLAQLFDSIDENITLSNRLTTEKRINILLSIKDNGEPMIQAEICFALARISSKKSTIHPELIALATKYLETSTHKYLIHSSVNILTLWIQKSSGIPENYMSYIILLKRVHQLVRQSGSIFEPLRASIIFCLSQFISIIKRPSRPLDTETNAFIIDILNELNGVQLPQKCSKGVYHIVYSLVTICSHGSGLSSYSDLRIRILMHCLHLNLEKSKDDQDGTNYTLETVKLVLRIISPFVKIGEELLKACFGEVLKETLRLTDSNIDDEIQTVALTSLTFIFTTTIENLKSANKGSVKSSVKSLYDIIYSRLSTSIEMESDEGLQATKTLILLNIKSEYDELE